MNAFMRPTLDAAQLAAIRALVLAADRGSLTEAAKSLGLTPSAVSRQVSRLEETLGARLLERTTRRVRATDAGLALIERARPLFEAFEEAGAAVRDLQSGVVGRVRLTASRAFGRVCLVPIVAALAAEHEGLQLDLLLDARRLDFVDDGIDLAVREGGLPDSSLTARKLGEASLQLYASPKYLAARGTPRSMEELRDHDLLALPAPGPSNDIAQVRGKNGRPLGLVARIRMNDLLALADLAERDAGVVALPVYAAADAMRAGRLVRLLPRAALGRLPLHVVYPGRRHLPRRVEVVLDRLRSDVPPLLR
jgi:DNA-binding transcriptional LysR family regulator